MLLRIYTIIALSIFLFLMYSGSSLEPALIRSVIVFVALVVGTRVSVYLFHIISENASTTNKKESSPSRN